MKEPIHRLGNGSPDAPPKSSELGANKAGGLEPLLQEAEALKALLRDAHARSARLLDALKARRRQSKLVESALGSLRHLQRVAE